MSSALHDFLAPVNKNYPNKEELIAQAVKAIENKEVFVFGFSGKKGAGKDTLANLFMDKFRERNMPAEDVPLSLGIRAEATEIFADINGWATRGTASIETFSEELAKKMDMDLIHARTIVDTMLPLVKEEPGITGWSRANEVTAMLQLLGNEIRLPKDNLYWVRKSLWSVAVNAVHGISSFNPSLRFVHDADSVKDVGGYLIRLNIDPAEQAERLLGRDGVVVPPETLNHPSETALDDYKSFDAIYNSTGQTAQGVFKKAWADWAKTNGQNSRI